MTWLSSTAASRCCSGRSISLYPRTHSRGVTFGPTSWGRRETTRHASRSSPCPMGRSRSVRPDGRWAYGPACCLGQGHTGAPRHDRLQLAAGPFGPLAVERGGTTRRHRRGLVLLRAVACGRRPVSVRGRHGAERGPVPWGAGRARGGCDWSRNGCSRAEYADGRHGFEDRGWALSLGSRCGPAARSQCRREAGGSAGRYAVVGGPRWVLGRIRANGQRWAGSRVSVRPGCFMLDVDGS